MITDILQSACVFLVFLAASLLAILTIIHEED